MFGRRKPCRFNLLRKDDRVFSKIRLILAAAILFSPLSSWGQTLPSDPVLDSLVMTVLRDNPDIQAAAQMARSAEYMVSPAGSLPDPMAMISLTGPTNGSWVGEPMATPNVMIGLTQMIPFPGKLGAMKNAAKDMAGGHRESLENTRQNMAAMVRSAYYELAYWDDALETVENNISFFDELEAVAREKYRVGQGIQANVLQAQAMRTRLEDEKLMVVKMIGMSQVMLAQLISDPSMEPVKASLPEMANLPLLDKSVLLSNLERENPRLRKSAFEIDMRRNMLRNAKLDYLPDFTFGVSYGFGQASEMIPMSGENMLGVSAGINIPLWAGWKQKNMVSSARADLRQAEYMKLDMNDQLRFELDKHLLEYDRDRSRYTLYKESLIPQSRAELESARVAYEVGKLEFMNVINAQMGLFDAELELRKSLADGLKSLAQIAALTAEAAPSLEK